MWAIEHSIPKKTLVLGADVFHDRGKKSCAALVAQFGSQLQNNFSIFKYHEGGQEIMDTMSEMVHDMVRHYESKMKEVPENIIFYRDGVGENQIEMVEQKEFVQTRNLLKKEYPGNTPKLTLIIVTKRIDDRFFLRQQRGM